MTIQSYPFAFKDALISSSAEYFANKNPEKLTELIALYSDTKLGGANDTNNKNFPNDNFILTKPMVMNLPSGFLYPPLVKFCTETCPRLSTMVSSLNRDGQISLSPRETLIFASEVFLKPQYGKDFLGKIAAEKYVEYLSKTSDPTIAICSDTGFIDELIALTKRVSELGQKVIVCSVGSYGFGAGATDKMKSFDGDSRDFVIHTVLDSVEYHLQHFMDQGFTEETMPIMKDLYRYDKLVELKTSLTEQLKIVMGDNKRDLNKKVAPLSFDNMILLVNNCEFKSVLNTKEENQKNVKDIQDLIEEVDKSDKSVVVAYSGCAGSGKDYLRDVFCKEIEAFNEKKLEISRSNQQER